MSGLTVGAPVTLSRDFTLKEFLRTATGLPNDPTADRQLANMIRLCRMILQPVRDVFGPLRVTSGFRSPEVNAAVSGSDKSQHLEGEAADIIPELATTREVFAWIAQATWLPIGQVILERPQGKSWVHVSLARPGRARQVLVWGGGVYTQWEKV